LVFAILVTLFCCLPLGIVAIVFAAKANSLKAAGDIAGALDAAQKAKVWTWLAFGLGILSIIITLAIGLGGFMAAMDGAVS
jgi:hypothetical protein